MSVLGDRGDGQDASGPDAVSADQADLPSSEAEISPPEVEEAQYVERLSFAAGEMVTALQPRRAFDKDFALARLEPALERLHIERSEIPGGSVGLLIFLLANLATPALLLQWSADSHRTIVEAVLFVIALGFGLVISVVVLLLALVLFADYFLSFEERILWAWVEAEVPEVVQEQSRNRRRAKRRFLAAVALLATFAGASLWFLRSTHGWFVELLCVGVLTPLIALFVAGTSGVIAAHMRRGRRFPEALLPGDLTMVSFLNLAYYALHSSERARTQADRSRLWEKPSPLQPVESSPGDLTTMSEKEAMRRARQLALSDEALQRARAAVVSEYTTIVGDRRRMIDELERAARAAEYEFPGRDRMAVRRDAAMNRWALDQSAKLAASVRQYKRQILLANRPEDLDELACDLSEAFAAAVESDWDALSASSPASSGPRRIRRIVATFGPIALLVVAAFALPKVPGLEANDAVTDSVRAYLLLAALLALVAVLSPESQKASSIIQNVADKLGPSRS